MFELNPGFELVMLGARAMARLSICLLVMLFVQMNKLGKEVLSASIIIALYL